VPLIESLTFALLAGKTLMAAGGTMDANLRGRGLSSAGPSSKNRGRVKAGPLTQARPSERRPGTCRRRLGSLQVWLQQKAAGPRAAVEAGEVTSLIPTTSNTQFGDGWPVVDRKGGPRLPVDNAPEKVAIVFAENSEHAMAPWGYLTEFD